MSSFRLASTALLLTFSCGVSAAKADLLMVGADATAPINGPNRLDIMRDRVLAGAVLGGYNFGNVDTFDAKAIAPSLATLEHYSAVIVWNNFGFADPTTLGNNLADYVDQGGGVLVMSVGSAIGPGGRWATDGYDPLLNAGFIGDVASSMASYVHSDPLFAGVSTINGEYIQTGSVRPGATLLASWIHSFNGVDPAPLAIEANGFNGQVIDLNFYGAYPYPNTSGDIDRLIANAMNELSTPAVVPEPSTLGICLVSAGLLAVCHYRRRKD